MKDNTIQGWFSENGFIMINPRKTLVFKSKNAMSLSRFEDNLEIMSLHDVV